MFDKVCGVPWDRDGGVPAYKRQRPRPPVAIPIPVPVAGAEPREDPSAPSEEASAESPAGARVDT
eukprot:11184668-Lingulodinium_polyedra.AAC.1